MSLSRLSTFYIFSYDFMTILMPFTFLTGFQDAQKSSVAFQTLFISVGLSVIVTACEFLRHTMSSISWLLAEALAHIFIAQRVFLDE